MDTKFRPVRGREQIILAMGYNEGYIYFATDTGNIFVDADGKSKIPLGGRGAAVLYSNTKAIQNSADDNYTLYLEGLEDPSATVRIGDLIINHQDNAFYKVVEVETDEEILTCMRIAVSGSGGGGGGTTGPVVRRGRLTVTNNGESDILNGSECTFTITATSGTEDNVPIDNELQLAIKYILTDTKQTFYT